jgi:hypothetical protein
MFQLYQSKVFEFNQEVRKGMCKGPRQHNSADRRELLRGSQALRGDIADSEGVGRLENANPLGRATNERSPILRNYFNALRSTTNPEVDEYKRVRKYRGEAFSIDNFGSCGRRLSPRGRR